MASPSTGIQASIETVRGLFDAGSDDLDRVEREVRVWLSTAVKDGEPSGPDDLSPEGVALVAVLIFSRLAPTASEIIEAGIQAEDAPRMADTIGLVVDRFSETLQSAEFGAFASALGSVQMGTVRGDPAPMPRKSPTTLQTRSMLVGQTRLVPMLNAVVRSPTGEVLAELEADWEEYWGFISSLATALVLDLDRRLPLARQNSLHVPEDDIASIEGSLEQIRLVLTEASSSVERLRSTKPDSSSADAEQAP